MQQWIIYDWITDVVRVLIRSQMMHSMFILGSCWAIFGKKQEDLKDRS